MGFHQETIHFCDGEEESEDPIQPSLGCPHNLKADWGMSLPIVVIHSMLEHEVVVDDLWVPEGGRLPHTAFLPISSCLLAVVVIICPVCGHEGHDVIVLFHGIHMKGDIVKCPCP